MAARAGMANLILRLRALTATTTSDYTQGAVTYWSDDQLQDILDRTRRDWRGVPLTEQPELGTDGQYDYHDYKIPLEIGTAFEEAGAGSIFAVKGVSGTLISSSDYTVNYAAGVIRFTADQAGLSFYLDCRTFRLNEAAAEVWEAKAAHAAAGVDWKTDNHAVSDSQEYDHCMAQAERFRKFGRGIQAIRRVRTDESRW